MAQFTATVAGDLRDPYPLLEAKRRETPVEIVRQPGFDGRVVPTCCVYRYDDVAAVLRDDSTFSSSAIRDLMGIVMGPYVLVGMDEPEHRRHRNLVSQAFRHKTLSAAVSEMVDPVVDDLIDAFESRGSAELVRELTFLFPVQVIAELLGVPHHDHAQFHHLAHAVINVAANPAAGLAASVALREYLGTIVDERRADPRDDVISQLVVAELDGERLDDEEIFSFLRLLLPAGAETTYRASGNLLFGLLSNPDQLDAVRADRSLVTAAVEECIRWETPLLITSRTATRDCEIAGVAVPAGMPLIAHVGSANRDEARWSSPERYDLHRPAVPHLSFGVGPHMCLGMHLARLELAGTLERLLDRLPGLRADPDRWVAEDAHIHGERFRSPTCLPVVF
jgi:cytochrome P450